MDYHLLKALHIIFVVTWFAGLFYIVRLFIYHVEAEEKSDTEKRVLQDQFKIMEKRLWYGITWPSCILTIFFGLSLIQFFLPLSKNPWLMYKLSFVFGLFLYQLYCGSIFRQLQQNQIKHSSFKLRILNEIATLFLVAIVFLVVLKSLLGLGKALLGLFILSLVLMIAIKAYRKIRAN